MPRITRLFNCLVVLLLAMPLTAVLAGDDARDVVRDIYRQVETACPKGGGQQPYNLAAIAEAHFTGDLRDQLARAYRDHALAFDILIDAQDCDIGDVDLDTIGDHHDGAQAVIRAKFKNFREKRLVDLLLVHESGQWKVADVSYRHRAWSLRRELAARGGK